MPEIVLVDEKGRIVIPKEARKKLNLARNSRLLLIELEDSLVLKKLDIKRLLETITREARDVDLEEIEREVEEEANRLASKKIQEVLTGR